MLLELRSKVKSWEREFEAKNNRKPSSADVKADHDIRKLYQRYKEERRKGQPQQTRQTPSTPKKNHNVEIPEDSATEEDEPTPMARKVTEVFPTPQLKGKVLGIFDVDIGTPRTPRKSVSGDNEDSPLSKMVTPNQRIDVETPQSKRTPDYLLQKVNLFPSQQLQSMPELRFESPLIKQKPQRSKSVSDLVKEASQIQENKTDLELRGNEEYEEFEEFEGDIPRLEFGNFAPKMPEQHSKGRSRPKRQTKRVIMRPVEEGELSTAKPTENYVRLKINHPAKNRFKRRRR